MTQQVPSPSELLTTKQAAEILNVSPRTVLNWIKDGLIPYVELPSSGRRHEYRIPREGLMAALGGNFKLDDSLT